METWNDAISLADATFRNNFDSKTKAMWLSMILAQIMALRFSRSTTFAFFDITQDIQDYDLPVDCRPSDILSIQVECPPGSGTFTDYEYQEPQEDPRESFYTILNGMFHLSLKPDEDKLGLIFYLGGSSVITEDNLVDAIPIPRAYREIFVHGLCERMAAARGDVARKNNFKVDFDTLLTDFLMGQLNDVPDYPVPKDELPRRSG